MTDPKRQHRKAWNARITVADVYGNVILSKEIKVVQERTADGLPSVAWYRRVPMDESLITAAKVQTLRRAT